jgi:hypothetical protein
MKKGEKETRVESEGGGVLAAAEQIAGHRPTILTQSTYNEEQLHAEAEKALAAAAGERNHLKGLRDESRPLRTGLKTESKVSKIESPQKGGTNLFLDFAAAPLNFTHKN